ncbi:TIGR04255 family protein [Telmatocola sphagniphila]|uniref:TIGR04255 family protein n=1 Tax=Telmatocola sphagniphila TaxID=1123043 RepID=A0A8E6B6T7_9BACT|nr:TIGR04255 family protein [Telmatocola sphagniphila]QVL32226.1 TIGR04255 family protein [Telmatocola sphagniphila]
MALFPLDLNEKFQKLSRPPIVEAVIHWQARATHSLDPESLKTVLLQRLPEYQIHEPMQLFPFAPNFGDKEATPLVHSTSGWQGIRMKSTDGRFIVQFTRDGLIFSRTQTYAHWEPFLEAAKAAWKVFVDVAAPVEIHRLGIRFINRIPVASNDKLSDILRDPPMCPANLPLQEFVNQSTFSVPGHPFGIRVIQILQPSMPELEKSSGLFLDIDVFTTKPLPNDSGTVADSLKKMRWLKNKVFFNLLTEKTIQSLV